MHHWVVFLEEASWEEGERKWEKGLGLREVVKKGREREAEEAGGC